MMFDGKVRNSSRPISMGGVKKDSSTKNLVDNARKLREQRLEERIKQNSATKIQSNWRGYHVRNLFRIRLISELDQKITSIKNIKNLLSLRNQIFNVPIESILIELKLFYFIYLRNTNAVTFESHLQFITTIILESLNVSIPEYNILCKLLSTSNDSLSKHDSEYGSYQKTIWIFYIKKFLQLILDYINKSFLLKTCTTNSDNMNLNTIHLLFQCIFFGNVNDDSNSQLELESSFILSSILQSIMSPVCKVLNNIFHRSHLMIAAQQLSNGSKDNVAAMIVSNAKVVSLLLQLLVKELKEERRRRRQALAITQHTCSTQTESARVGVSWIVKDTAGIQTFVTKTILTLPDLHLCNIYIHNGHISNNRNNSNVFLSLFQYLEESDREGWRMSLNMAGNLTDEVMVDIDENSLVKLKETTSSATRLNEITKMKNKSNVNAINYNINNIEESTSSLASTSTTQHSSLQQQSSESYHVYGMFLADNLLRVAIFQNFIRCSVTADHPHSTSTSSSSLMHHHHHHHHHLHKQQQHSKDQNYFTPISSESSSSSHTATMGANHANFLHHHYTSVANTHAISKWNFPPQGLKFILSNETSPASSATAKDGGSFGFMRQLRDVLEYSPLVLTQYLMEHSHSNSGTFDTDNTVDLSPVSASGAVESVDIGGGIKIIEYELYRHHLSIRRREKLQLLSMDSLVTSVSSPVNANSSSQVTNSSVSTSTPPISSVICNISPISVRPPLNAVADLLIILSATGSDVLVTALDNTASILSSNMNTKKAKNESSHLLLFLLSEVYMKILCTASSTSFESSSFQQLQKQSLQSAQTTNANILLSESYCFNNRSSSGGSNSVFLGSSSSSSIGDHLLHKFTFSRVIGREPLVKQLWKYLCSTTITPFELKGMSGSGVGAADLIAGRQLDTLTDVLFEALQLKDEYHQQKIDRYNKIINSANSSSNTSNLFTRSTQHSASSSNSNVTWQMISSSQCSRSLNIAASALDINCHDFCMGVAAVFWMFCTLFAVQLSATDDEELFESQDYVQVNDIKIIVHFLKKLLYRLYCTSYSFAATHLTSLSSASLMTQTQIHQQSWDKFSMYYSSSSQQQSNSGSSTTITTSHEKKNIWLQYFGSVREVMDVEYIQLSRCHQLWVYTRLFNALFAVNLRRPFMSSAEWQWTGVLAVVPGDLENKMQQLARHEGDSSSSVTATAGTIGSSSGEATVDMMTSLLAKDCYKPVLQVIPQVIPFAQRISIFHALIALDSHKHVSSHAISTGSTHIQIQRSNILEDSYTQLAAVNQNKLKGRIKVEFISETGLQEAGIDGGGLFKAFLDLFMKHAFDPTLGLFVATPDTQQLLTPNTGSALAVDQHLTYFNFIGKMLGVAVYHRILVEPQLTGTFLNALLGKSNHINELYYLDKQILKSLMDLKHMATTTVAGTDDPIAALGMYFEIDRSAYDMNITQELIPNGASTLVTKHNVHTYIHKYAHYILNVETATQTRAFLAGFRQLVPMEWIRIFSTRELQLLISGEQKPIDIADLRRNVNYGGGYADSQPYIQVFWKIIESLDIHHQGLFLRFVTSCSRQPLLGFSKLNPKIGIQKVSCYSLPVDGSDSSDASASITPAAARLPSAATCMNLLKLPQYDSEDILREKLIYAITSESGFELS